MGPTSMWGSEDGADYVSLQNYFLFGTLCIISTTTTYYRTIEHSASKRRTAQQGSTRLVVAAVDTAMSRSVHGSPIPTIPAWPADPNFPSSLGLDGSNFGNLMFNLIITHKYMIIVNFNGLTDRRSPLTHHPPPQFPAAHHGVGMRQFFITAVRRRGGNPSVAQDDCADPMVVVRVPRASPQLLCIVIVHLGLDVVRVLSQGTG